MRLTYIKAFSTLLFLTGACGLSLTAGTNPVDSIGVTYQDGQKVIVHKLKSKETYYGLSRHYNVPVKNIIAANQNKALKAGDTLHIPTSPNSIASAAPPSTGNAASDTPHTKSTAVFVATPQNHTEYKVGTKETLFAISKRFMVTIATIKKANNLTDDSLKAGMLLKIPHENLPEEIPESQVALSDVIDNSEPETTLELPANKYGIRELTERGLGVWIDDLNQEGSSMLALHKTAPIGTVIKITNPMTNRTTFAKVVGKFTDNAETQNAIIVISKSAASLIGVLDRRFQVEIAYGAPIE